MANRTVKDAHSIKGTNPQYLIEKIIRTRIYECRYWKEECFALTAALLVDKAMELKFVGGVYGGNVKPSPFICLILKMLQIQPEKDIVVEFIRNEDFKYVRALGAFYMRLTGTSMDCYKYLEPLYYDYRKMRIMNRSGKFELTHVDEFIDTLLRDERSCDVILPRIQKRNVLEESNQLETRVSAVEEDIDEMDEDEEEEEEVVGELRPSPAPEKRSHKDGERNERNVPPPVSKRSRSRSPHKRDRHAKHRDVKVESRVKDREKRHRSPGKRHRELEEERKRKTRKTRSDRERTEGDRERHRDRGNREKSDRERDRDRRHRDRDHGKSRNHHSRTDDAEIREANELRSKLGLAPLRP